jgi:hypothetical protein
VHLWFRFIVLSFITVSVCILCLSYNVKKY